MLEDVERSNQKPGLDQQQAILILRGKEYIVRCGVPVHQAIREAGLIPETVIPTRNGEMIPDDEQVRPGDRIELIAIVSGG